MNLFASGTTFSSLVVSLVSFISGLAYILIGLSIIYFFVGIVKYIYHPDDKQRTSLLWSLIALFVLVSFVGLVRILLNTLGS